SSLCVIELIADGIDERPGDRNDVAFGGIGVRGARGSGPARGVGRRGYKTERGGQEARCQPPGGAAYSASPEAQQLIALRATFRQREAEAEGPVENPPCLGETQRVAGRPEHHSRDVD